MPFDFVHLHAHSEYSFDVGFFSIDDYVKYCYENKYYIVSLTERFNLFSVVKFYKKCHEFGIKPIIGCELFLEHKTNKHSKFLLLCQNTTGYNNLVKLLTKTYSENLVRGIPIVKRKWLPFLSEGLIAIGLSSESDIGLFLINNDYIKAASALQFWYKVFPNRYYLSVTRFGLSLESFYINSLFDFLDSHKVCLVATNEVCFLRPLDFSFYKSKIAIFDLNKKLVLDVHDTYFKNRYLRLPQDMYDLFSDMPELLYNSVEISKRCNLILKFSNNYSPKYLKCGYNTATQFLFKVAIERLFFRLLNIDVSIWETYVARLYRELDVINSVGFSSYFLVTRDFVNWAKSNDVFVGPGRGSGSGSLIAYLLSITDIDPVKYDLLFERFLNVERLSVPDFDIDFCVEGRDLVIDYVFEKYGINNVAQILTFGCMTVKAAIRDVGRVLGYSYSFVDYIVKLFPKNVKSSLKYELVHNLRLKEEYNLSLDIQNIVDLSVKLEGLVKGIGKHAGGVIISSVGMFGNLPLGYERWDFNFITHVDKSDSESFGFIKFDFLGLKTLSLISTIVEGFLAYSSFYNELEFDFECFNLYDKRTLFLLQCGDTTGIFQLESIGMKSIVQIMKPNLFADVIALVALYRPGPLRSGMLRSFINRKLGLENVTYIDDRLSVILKETYGVLIFQEQIMLLVQLFAKYTLANADLLRIAISKKDFKGMRVHLEKFVCGAMSNNMSKSAATKIFSLIEKFAGYGFNKAHSVGYALIAYHSAWFKANYNIFFMLALLSSDMDSYDSISLYLKEMRCFGISVLCPDINRSFFCFTLFNKKVIYYGLGAIKGLGGVVISEIVHNRSVFGPYSSFFDFFYRVDVTLFSKKTIQLLVYSGVFDRLDSLRFKLVLVSSKIFDLYFSLKNTNFYLSSLFIEDFFNYMIKNFSYLMEYRQNEIMYEREILCDYVSLNPLILYKSDSVLISKLSFRSGKYFNEFFVGVIVNIILKGLIYNKQVILTVKTLIKEYNIIIPYLRYKSFKDVVRKYNFVVVCAYLYSGYFYDLFIDDFYSFRYNFVEYLDLVFCDLFFSESFLKYFFLIVSKKIVSGNTCIRFKLPFNGSYKYIILSDKKVALHDDLINTILKFKEIDKVELFYKF